MWAAQQAFDTACSGGLNVNEYCSTAAETCCGVCNVVPISGPGSVLANLLATLLNLCFALHFRSETPYTLFFQMLGTDFAVFSLIDRALQPVNRISLWHYSFVPLTACSVVPIIVGCCLSRLKYMHNLSSSAEVAIAAGLRPSVEDSPEPSRVGHPAHHAASPRTSYRSLEKHKPAKKRRNRSGHVNEADPSNYGKVHQTLARTVLWSTLFHIVFYAAAFIGVFGFVDKSMPTSQASCIEVYGLNQWRVGMASFAGVMLVIALVFWLCLWRAMDKQFREKRKLQDGLETFVATFCAVFHLASLKNWVMPPGDYYTAKSRKNGLRWGLSIAVYLLWAVPYAVLYVKAGNEFILPGLNPWPYEQVAGAVSILVPICIVARSYVNEKDGYDGKLKALADAKTARDDDARRGQHASTANSRKDSLIHTIGSASGVDQEHVMSGALQRRRSTRHGRAGDEGATQNRTSSTSDSDESVETDSLYRDDALSPDERRRRRRLHLHTSQNPEHRDSSISPLDDDHDLIPQPLFSGRSSRRTVPSPLTPQAGAAHDGSRHHRSSSTSTTASDDAYFRDARRIKKDLGPDVVPAVRYMRRQDAQRRE